MVSAYLGRAWTVENAVHLTVADAQTNVRIAPVAYRDESFRLPLYYGYRVAWLPDAGRGFALEAEFIHLKMFARTERLAHVQGVWHGAPIDADQPLGSIVQRLAMSHGLNFVLANLAFRRELRHGLVGVVKAGAGPTVAHVETTLEGTSHDRYARGGLGAQVGGGIEATLVRQLIMLAEYKFTWASPTLDIGRGTAAVPARNHQVVAGIGYRF
jgi:hypothetical protein